MIKKIFLPLLFICLIQISFAQKTDLSPNIKKFKNDTVVWHPDSLLHVSDFKSKHNSSAYGLTYTGIFLYPKESNGNLNFYVEAIFVKSKSYLKTTSEYVLKHEQLHFDICELFARKLRQKILALDFKKIRNVQDVVKNLYAKVSQEMIKEQDKYDSETEHGFNSARQQAWSEKVKKQLDELEKFSSTEVDITK